MAAELTDAKIIDVADDFKSQYQACGVTVDQFDYFGFARAIWALATQQATQGAEPVAVVGKGAGGGVGVTYLPGLYSLPVGTKLYTAPPPTVEVEKDVARLRETLINVRQALQAANDTPNGPICDTIWLSGCETLFDYIDAALQSDQAQAGKGV